MHIKWVTIDAEIAQVRPGWYAVERCMCLELTAVLLRVELFHHLGHIGIHARVAGNQQGQDTLKPYCA